MKKRLLSMLLVFCMVLTLLPTTALAAGTVVDSGYCGGEGNGTNVTWTLTDDGVLTISGTGSMGSFEQTLTPAPWHSYRSSITSVIVDDGVTSIGHCAFDGCSSLTSIAIPDTVTSIGNCAFQRCSSLTSITIPDSVTSIDHYAFEYCSSLTSITIPDSVTSIGEGAFNYCSSLSSVTIPDSVTSIGDYAFGYCSGLTSINIPDSITEIADGMFFTCTSLASITIPDSVTSIGNCAFQSCSSLTSIIIPDGVTNIGEGAFYYCSSLTNITIPDGVTGIRDWAFQGCSSLTNITIPDGVTGIGDWAFQDCSSLTSITIPDSVTSIGDYAFDGCDSLTDVYYSGTEEQWKATSIGYSGEELTSATIHYNSTGPGDGGPVLPHSGSVKFFSSWDANSNQAFFNGNILAYSVTGNTDTSAVSSIGELLNKYVLVETDETNLFEITSIKPVESAIGTVTATGEHSLTIDGTTYPVQGDYALGTYDGEEVLYHTASGAIVGVEVLEEKTGILEAWDSATGQATIDGTVYPTNYLSDLSFQDNIDEYLRKGVYFVTGGSSNYTPLFKITGSYYPGGELEDFDSTIYHASWLAKGGNDADILNYDTPSDIMMDSIEESGTYIAIAFWRSFELIFGSLSNITTLSDFALGLEQKDMYSALILAALEASVSYDVIPSQVQEGVKLSRSLISSVADALKADYGIVLNNDDKLQDILFRMPGVNVDAYLEGMTKEWFKRTQPDLGRLQQSFKWISNGVRAVETVEDYAEYIAACITLSQTDEYIKEVLNLAYQKSSRVYGSTHSMTRAFKECLDMFSSSTEELFEDIQAGAIKVLGKDGGKYIVGDMLWKKVRDYIYTVCPEVAILQMGYVAGKTISNWLCDTDDTVEQYLKMDFITDIESMIDSIYRDLRIDFGSQKDVKTAATYLGAMEFSFQLRGVDCDTAYKFVDILDGSLLSKIEQAFGAQSGEGMKNTIENIRNNYQVNYIGAETNWIFYLEDDYPGSGLYEQYEHLINETRNTILKKEITAACPVNVYVLDSSGNVVASVVDGRVSCGADDIMIAMLGDTKVIRLYAGADYQIQYVGYDTGDMDITISEFDGNENTIRTVNYYDVALENGKTYSISVDDGTLKPYELVDAGDNAVENWDYDSMTTATAHKVKVISGTLQHGGEIYTETAASKGETLQLNAYIPNGYEFVRWQASNGEEIFNSNSQPSTTFVMPDEDITIRAILKSKQTTNPDNSENDNTGNNNGTGNSNASGGGANTNGSDDHFPKYSITVSSPVNGKVTISPTSASNGDTVTITTAPDSGFRLDNLTVTDRKSNTVALTNIGGGKYTFKMPASAVTIAASFTPSAANPFTDIAAGSWYYDAVLWAAKNGITTGDGSTTIFNPNGVCTRAQVVTFLWRACNQPAPAASTTEFTDVDLGGWYGKPVLWAREKGITTGNNSRTTFDPNGACTRAQVVTFLWRNAGFLLPAGSSSTFTDVPADAYYTEAVQWAVEQGITNGDGGANIFNPNGVCTRAQIVTFLYRYMAMGS